MKRSLLLSALLLLTLSPHIRAATITWDGDLSDVWTAAVFNGVTWNTNWDNDGLPIPLLPGGADTVVFTGASPNTTIDLSGNVQVNDIVFGGTVDYTLGTVIGAQTIALVSGDIDTTGFANTLTVNTDVAIGADGTWDIGSTIAMVMNGEVQGGTLTKTGTGVLSFGNNNTHNATRVENGTLAITAVNQLGVSNALTTLAGGELRFDGPLNAGASRPIALESNASSINTNGQDVEWSSVLSGTGSFTKSGTGMLTLDAANTYTGTTTISDGTLRIGNGGSGGVIVGNIVNNSALIFNKSIPYAYGGTISGSGAVTKDGSGTLKLSGVNTYTGGTTVNSGLLQLTNNGAVGTGTMTMNGGTLQYDNSVDLANTLDLQANANLFVGTGSATHSGVIQGGSGFIKTGSASLTLTGANTYTGGTFLNAGELVVSSDSNLGGSNGDLTLDGGTLTLGASFDLSNTRDVAINAGGGTVNTNGFDATISQAITGTGDLTKDGDGTLTLEGDVFSIGSVDVRRGVLRVNATGIVLPDGGLTVGTAGNPAELQIQGGQYTGNFGTPSTIGPDGTVAVTTGGRFDPSGDLDINGGTLALDATAGFSLDNGRTLTAFNNAQVDFADNYFINFGTHFDLQSGSDLVVGDYFDLAEGTLTVDGFGTTVHTNTTDFTASDWGYSATSTVTVRNAATYTINNNANLFLGDSGLGSATLNIESDADFNANNLTVATTPFGTATINLTGSGSTLIQSGTSSLAIGSSDPGATGTGTINVTDNATFDTGTGVIDVKATGAINIGTGNPGGTFNANADMDIDGGSLTRDASGVFELASGKTLTATNDAQLDFGGNYELNDGTTFNLQSGADLVVGNFFDIGSAAGGGSGNGTLIVDGVGTTVTANGANHIWGGGGITADVTFRNSATGTFGGVGLAQNGAAGTAGTLNVESGASVTIDALNIAEDGGPVTGVVNIDGVGSSLSQNGASNLFVGHTTESNAAINITNDGTFNSGTGVVNVEATGTINLGTGGAGGTFNANGDMDLSGTVNFIDGQLNAGLITLNPGGAFSFTGGTLTVETFNGDLTQDGGTLAPGTSPGTTAITGHYNMNAGTLEVEIFGGGVSPLAGSDFDQVIIAGDATLAGDLSVIVDPNYVPTPGITFQIVDVNGSLNGTFNGLADGDLVGNFGGVDLFIDYDAGDGNDIALFSAGLPGDFDLDGKIDGIDFLTWQRGFGTIYDSADLADWETNFGLTSAVAAAAAVPEPTSLLLALSTLCLLTRRRR